MEAIEWSGPFSWPGYEHLTKLSPIPEVEGVYLFTFPYNDGFVLYCAGITKSMKRRLRDHTREYRKGNYTILDVSYAIKGVRQEIWHGWEYAKAHRDEFEKNRNEILQAVENQLCAFRIFIAEMHDTRKRGRLESAFMNNLYLNKEDWADLADRGMFLKGRYNSEMPILIKNICNYKIYGVPTTIEI
ncbi:hypothetical protein JW964_19685 [candidate division KSB1 bacterium]|nr:hypothetical protein [candidate division KSB1 bacterium]